MMMIHRRFRCLLVAWRLTFRGGSCLSISAHWTWGTAESHCGSLMRSLQVCWVDCRKLHVPNELDLEEEEKIIAFIHWAPTRICNCFVSFTALSVRLRGCSSCTIANVLLISQPKSPSYSLNLRQRTTQHSSLKSGRPSALTHLPIFVVLDGDFCNAKWINADRHNNNWISLRIWANCLIFSFWWWR